MKLPNAKLATVDERKLADPLPDNGGKAAFFRALGYSGQSTAAAGAGPRRRSRSPVESVHGRKYVLDGAIKSPVGKSAVVRTVWIVDTSDDVPRLVTAYPRE